MDYLRGIEIYRGRFAKDIVIIDTKKDNVTLDNATPHSIRGVQIDYINSNTSCGLNDIYFKKFYRKLFVAESRPLILLGLVITVQCCLIIGLFICVTKSCNCKKEKKVVRKFFNYRQDVSVTTPLINTSNNDTEIDDPFFSDSTKVDQKIKCYKACQKETGNNVRQSLSDDILSKCLNRRDWGKHIRKPDESSEVNGEENTFDTKAATQGKHESKVIFEDETKHKVVANTCSHAPLRVKDKTSDKDISTNLSSEQEIKCHNYNINSVSDTTGFQSKVTKTYHSQDKNTTNFIDTEKSAQAYFSNDSIDDFLSERGMLNLNGGNITNFFSESSIKPTSSHTSKTSKSMLRQMLSLFHKKSKKSLSDPGGKSQEHFNVQLIHMSKATVYSSSDESNYGLRKQVDSRTSL
ncbi:uncharacterized protein LOC126974618 [Leptidea sinapis]|uniref:uncharacterized protein LOC126974618 n=1 Tax=Leptidea sinapis TaxID=189913 RepID=UPI0021C481F9|nr:uncharacterized protein LOC126974618 [Leptidea sinapis]